MATSRFTVSKSPEEVDPSSATGSGSSNADDMDFVKIRIEDANGLQVPMGAKRNTKVLAKGSEVSNASGLYEDDMKKGKLSLLLSGIANYSAGIAPNPERAEDNQEYQTHANLGTILGVYLPCIQNIFGVIYFVRLAWIVGVAGSMEAFFIVLMCCFVSLLTSFSLSAIATNGVVAGGGTYFMISRGLGPEFGGAVGILFYLGLSISVAMYFIGTVEILLTYMAPSISIFGDITNLNNQHNNFRVYGTAILFLMSLVVFVGVKFVTKFATLTLACVILSVLSIYIGFFTSNASNSVEICMLGEKLVSYNTVFYNGTIRCDKLIGGPLHNTYCNLVNGSYQCDPYFNSNPTQLMAGIPGLSTDVFIENAWPRYSPVGTIAGTKKRGDTSKGEIVTDISVSFIILLAIYLPSITGFEQGSNYSGDLEDAQLSIPKGTLWAVLSTSAIYLSTVLFLGGCVEGVFLRDKYGESIGGGLLVSEVAWPNKWVILVGSFQSTVGAGLQALTGAPRLLQAIAKDNVIPFLQIFRVTSKSGEPVRALLFTIFIAELGIVIARLDYVAPIVGMFFLLCYGFINMACALQTLLRSPHWRPRYHFYHWTLSLLGLALCLSLMFLSSWYYTAIAFILTCAVYKYIEYKGAEKEWGDGMRGLAVSAANYALLRIRGEGKHTKNWRPQLLILMKPDVALFPSHPQMLRFAAQLKAGKGITLVNTVLEGDYIERAVEGRAAKMILNDFMDGYGVRGFTQVVTSPDVIQGLTHCIQTAGLGKLRHNTVMVGWPSHWTDDPDQSARFLSVLQAIATANLSLMVTKGVDGFPESTDRLTGTIDVWWIVHDGGMLLLLAFLLQQNPTWKHCTLRIFTIAQLEDNSVQLKRDIEKYLYHLRIKANVTVVELIDSDISAYIYERTLQMEERSKLIQNMRLKKHASKNQLQDIVDNAHSQRDFMTIEKIEPLEDVLEETEPLPVIGALSAVDVPSSERIQYTYSSITQLRRETYYKQPQRKPDKKNVRKMHTAIELNKHIASLSKEAEIVIVNMPSFPTTPCNNENYMTFLEVLTEGIDRVLMVRGCGQEVITIYS